jgi:hypothetical protein
MCVRGCLRVASGCIAIVFAAALVSCSSGGTTDSQPPPSTAATTVGLRRAFDVVVAGSTGPVGQDIHTLKPVNPPSGRPTYSARNLGPGCSRCQITDLSPNAEFDAGGTLTQKIVWRAASGNTLRGNYVGHFVQLSKTPPFTGGHMNRFVGKITIVGGTGAFVGATGTLNDVYTTTIVSVDAMAGIAYKKQVNISRGVLTYPGI